MGATLFPKSELATQLNGLEKIWNDFLNDEELQIAGPSARAAMKA